MPRWVKWAAGAAAAIVVFRDPAGAGHAVQQAWHAAWTFVGSL